VHNFAWKEITNTTMYNECYTFRQEVMQKKLKELQKEKEGRTKAV
jgi:hypothetical protein